jgi:hypothetical protein
VGLCLGLGLGGCGAGGDADEDSGADTESGGEVLPGPPVLVEPIGTVVVDASQRVDLVITAADLLPSTRVELDGQSFSLAGSGPVLRAGQTLQVPLAGALVVAEHELVLVHEVGGERLRSEPLVIAVEGATTSSVSASVEAELVGLGDRLLDVGPPGASLGWLAIVDDEAETVELRRDDWAAAGISIAIPGLGSELGAALGAALGSGLASVDLGEVELAGQRGLVIAWLADDGERAQVRVTPIDARGQLGEPGPISTVWELADPEHRALLGPHQLAFDHGVALLDRLVVVAVEARRDAESATPGDRVLATRWLSAEGRLGDPQVVRGPGGRDLDLPRRAERWLDLGPPTPALSVRVAQAYPWLLELAGNGLAILASDPGEQVSAPGPEVVWMATADGALGSRTGFALELDGEQARLRVLRIDRWGSPPLVAPAGVDVIELPAIPSAPPSLTLLAGIPTLVIPFGAELPVWAVRSSGDAAVIDELALLRCDALVVDRPGPAGEGAVAGEREGGEVQPLACLRERELRLGQLGTSD